jgi:hypothetical protein
MYKIVDIDSSDSFYDKKDELIGKVVDASQSERVWYKWVTGNLKFEDGNTIFFHRIKIERLKI